MMRDTNQKETEGKMSISRWRLLIISMTVCAVIVASVLIFQTGEPHNPPKITIGTSHSLSAALLLFAKQKKLFADEGLDVELKYYSSAGKGFQDMLKGNVHISAVASSPIVKASFLHQNIRVFATINSSLDDAKILARKSSGISSAENLKGKRIGTTPPGQSAHYFLYLYLLENGLSLKDITLVHDSPAIILNALENGELDAACLFEPYVIQGVKHMGQNSLVLSSPGLYLKHFNLVTKQSYLENNRELIEKILRAVIKADKLINILPEEIVAIVAKESELEKETVSKMYSSSYFITTLSEELIMSMNMEAKWLKNTMHLDGRDIPNAANIIDLRPLQSISPYRVLMSAKQY